MLKYVFSEGYSACILPAVHGVSPGDLARDGAFARELMSLKCWHHRPRGGVWKKGKRAFEASRASIVPQLYRAGGINASGVQSRESKDYLKS